jgi:hypothetical protein
MWPCKSTPCSHPKSSTPTLAIYTLLLASVARVVRSDDAGVVHEPPSASAVDTSACTDTPLIDCLIITLDAYVTAVHDNLYEHTYMAPTKQHCDSVYLVRTCTVLATPDSVP